MRIAKLAIQNFRIISNAVLDWKDSQFVVIKGKKFAGKSSIGQAISMILASTTEGLDMQGRGFEGKIKDGESKAVLSAQIQGKHLIERVVTLNTNTSGRVSKSNCLDDPDWHPMPFDNFLAKYKDALTVSTNTSYFANLGEKEQKNLLAKLVLPDRYDFPKDKIAEVEKMIGPGVINFEGEPFSVIAQAYKKLYDERAFANRQVKEFSIPDPIQVSSPIDLESLQKQISDAKEKRNAILAQKDESVREANEIEVKRASLETKIEALLEKVEGAKQKVSELSKSILTSDKLKEYQRVAENKDRYFQLTQARAELDVKIAQASKDIDKYKKLPKNGINCDKCEQPITPQYAEGLLKFATEQRTNACESDAEILAELKSLGDIEGALQAIKSHQEAVEKRAEIENSVSETVKVGKETRKELNALPPATNPSESFVLPLAEIDARIDELSALLAPVIGAEQRNREVKEKTVQLEKLTAKAKNADDLVKYFDKDGIKAKLIAEYIGSFENSIQDVLSIFGYQCSLKLDPFDFSVVTARGYKGPVKELSGAEKHMFYATLQLAVSIAAGIRMVVIDEVQELGDDLQKLFYSKVFELIQSQELEQAILIGYSLDKTVPARRAPGSDYYYVTDGVVERLK